MERSKTRIQRKFLPAGPEKCETFEAALGSHQPSATLPGPAISHLITRIRPHNILEKMAAEGGSAKDPFYVGFAISGEHVTTSSCPQYENILHG